jgi:hypothetical protein
MKRLFFVLIALLTSVSSARDTIVQWDNGPNWPAGTTVELCANSVCENGIAGNTKTLSVPVQPGGIIDAKARSVAPIGYQCGSPLAACPYSDWTTLVQTLPADQNGLWATKKSNGNNMAISFVQSALGGSVGGGTAMSVNLTGVGANNLIVVWARWEGDNAAVTTSCSDGTSTFSNGTQTRGGTSDQYAQFFYLTAANSGNKTYTVTLSASRTTFYVHAWEFSTGGVVVDVQASGNGDSGTSLATGSFSTTGTTELVMGAVTNWTSTTFSNLSIGGVAATGNQGDNAYAGRSFYRIATVSSGTVSATASASTAWIAQAISFKESGGAAASSPPVNPIGRYAYILGR